MVVVEVVVVVVMMIVVVVTGFGLGEGEGGQIGVNNKRKRAGLFVLLRSVWFFLLMSFWVVSVEGFCGRFVFLLLVGGGWFGLFGW